MVDPEVSEKDAGSRTTKKEPNWVKNIRYYFTEYCDNTSIHGLKFLGEQKRFLVEKIWWLIFISISLYFCISLILNTYNKWMTAPVIVSFATSETPIWKIPFPAVTVCPMIKSEKTKFDYAKMLAWKETNTEYVKKNVREFGYMSLVCKSTLQAFADKNATRFFDNGVINFLIKIAPNFDSAIHRCRWVGENCTFELNRYFSPILTSVGVCYSLNMLDRDEIFTSEANLDYYKDIEHQEPSDWNLEDGYPEEAQLRTYPKRTVLSGPNGGLDLVFYTDGQNIDYSCGDSTQGYKILLHHPGQIPRSHQRYFWLPLNQIVSASVKPNMMETSSELRHYDPKDRKCYFSKEKKLKFFKIYNQQNCVFECLTNYTYQQCGCVGFSMPRHNSTPICGPAMRRCIEAVTMKFLMKEAKFERDNSKTNKTAKSTKKNNNVNCDCLPSCYDIHYDIETSQMDWDWRQSKIGNEYNNETAHMSRLRIFFKDLQFMTSERNELFGQTDFIANCGGLLGLFTGFSFISLVEILYFVTLRLVCNLRKFGRRYWSGAEEVLQNKVD